MNRWCPDLTIAQDALSSVEDVVYDGDQYAEYLASRQMSEEAIADLSLVVTNQGIRTMAMANYSPPILDIENEGAVIRFSPTRMPFSLPRQAKIFRHETEHFIHSTRRGYKLFASSKLAGISLAAIAGGLYLGKHGLEVSEEIATDWPEAFRLGAEAAGASLGGAVGGTALWIVALNYVKALSPDEFLARRAEKKRADELPDDTLQIFFRGAPYAH